MTETVLVTGGTGYIAGWCITDLLSRGYRVRTTVRGTAREAVVRSAVASVVEAEDRLSFAVADLTSPAGWDAALDGVDYVLHVASPLSGDDMLTPAREGVRNVLSAAAAAGVKRVVMTSAANAASPRPTPKRVSPTRPRGRTRKIRRSSLPSLQNRCGEGSLGLHGIVRRPDDAGDGPAWRGFRTDPVDRFDRLGPDHRAHAEGIHARQPTNRTGDRGRADLVDIHVAR